MRKRHWSDLSRRSRTVIVVGGAVDGALKIAALADLARRPQSEIEGSKTAWAIAILFLNSLGAVPILYLVRARRSA